ncbi:hypothetical protein QVD17_16005 [Tagetes erecta]|uniref:Erythronate-4-phosphate dehydrogenase family protein n=1 Tax=Tagetes erecta TaxID=13708 RepID=A0AAD8P063_TARER|nr:hypothetical protein QVD17_16005 [Tagetes erecta]
MENLNGTTKNNLQIIKHPSYQTYTKPLLAWFDIRVFYVRISNFMVDGYTPEYLTLSHIPLDPDTILEVNNKRCTLDSQGILCRLKRNRIDKKFEEATFVSTDSIRLSGSVKFEVFDGEDLMLSGVLEMDKDNNKSKNNDVERWSMECESMIGANSRVFKGKHIMGCDSMPPMIEVYVAGSFSGSPVILTKTLQIGLRKKQTRKGALDPIPEGETTEPRNDAASGLVLQEAEYGAYKPENEYDYNYNNNLHWSQDEYMDGEDGELTWFNAGVRVGVGLGLGICLGVGIGVGLLVRTYQSTTRNFRRRLL